MKTLMTAVIALALTAGLNGVARADTLVDHKGDIDESRQAACIDIHPDKTARGVVAGIDTR